MTYTVGIAGASGYAGGELLRLLAGHPDFEVKVISAGAKAGESVASVHPHLNEWRGRTFASSKPENFAGLDLVFMALPHGTSAEIATQISADTKIVDLGADFRLQSDADWKKYYSSTIPHAGTWTYGLPELVSKEVIAQSQRVANPGCYATAIALAAAPVVKNGLVDATDLVVVAASGTSGAGRTATESLLGSEVMNSISSYKTGGVHQHTPEIEQTLSSISESKVGLSFTPLLAPMPRGIHVTFTAKLVKDISALNEIYADFYQESPFVVVLGDNEQPKTASVLGSNFAHVQALVDSHTNRVVVTAVIDNLVKGAAGQAIQNANLMFGISESTGLLVNGVAP